MKNVFLVTGILMAAFVLTFGSVYVVEAGGLAQTAEDGQAIFQQKCTSCHTVGGGRLVGPDLAGVTTRRDAAWIQQFIADAPGMIATGDPTATQLLAEYNNIPMPNLGLPESEVAALMAYLETTAGAAPGAEPAAQPGAAPQAGQAVLVGGDPANGEMIFTGAAGLTNSGTPCIACHSVGGVGALEGGSIGPDLTHVYARYGEAGLVGVLDNITFPTMQGAFGTRPLLRQEQADLVAFFQQADQTAPPPYINLTMIFLLIGTGGAVLLFAFMAFFWPRQRESLSDRLRRTSQ